MSSKFVALKISVLLLPSLFWLGLTACNVGAQSLSNLIELAAVALLSLLSIFIPNKYIPVGYIISGLLVIALLLRLCCPIFPE